MRLLTRLNKVISRAATHRRRVPQKLNSGIEWSQVVRLVIILALGLTFQAAADDSIVRLLVKWRDGPASAAAVEGNARIGATVKRNFPALGWQLVELPPGLSAGDALRAYQQLASVAAVEPDGRVALEPPRAPSTGPRPVDIHPLSLTPDDPRYNSQWHLRKIAAPEAWDITTGSSNVVVAVIESSGVDYTHPDLAANMWHNPGETGVDDQGRDKATNGLDDDNNGFVDDVHGANVRDGTGDPMDVGSWSSPDINRSYHGTFVAGVVGAVGNNRLGITGVAWSVQLMAVRFGGGDSSDPQVYTPTLFASGLLAAWDYVLMMRRRGVNIRVANNSYGGFLDIPALRDAMTQAGEEGILSVCSAGNVGANTDLMSHFPQAFNSPGIISVAASDRSDSLVNIEVGVGSNFGRSTVDLAAPGVDITSTWAGANYEIWGGTSFAVPQVVGTAALLLTVNPNLTVDELKAALFGSVDQPASMRGRLVTNGRLNVVRALQYLTNANPPAIVITALPAGQRTPVNHPIQVTFNRPMNRASVESAFVIEPAVSGAFEWSADNRSFSFQHDAPFDSTTNYTLRILGTAEDASGGTLDGDFDRTREGSPVDDYLWTFRFPVANDDFANAQTLTGSSGFIQSSNRYATYELFEPDHLGDRTSTSSVWYHWTPPAEGGWFTFDLTTGTPFDSLLAVYVGDEIDQLTAVAGNDNYGTRIAGRLSFAASAAMSYQIVVAGKSGDVTKRVVAPNQSGAFQLSWYPTPAPGFTGFSPASGIPGARITLAGTNFTGATEVRFGGASASFTNAPANYLDLRITAVVPPDATSGPISILTPHGEVTSTNSFQVLPPPLSVTFSSVGGLELSWPATSGAIELESTDNLSAASWSPVTEPLTRINGVTRVTIPAGPGGRYYRLKAP